MRGIQIGDRILLAGQTGMGKTTLADYLADSLQPIRTIVVDPKGELQLQVEPVGTLEQLPEALRQPVCHYIPTTLDAKTLEEAFALIWATPGPWLLWVDEAAAVSSAGWCPEGLRLAVTQGRQPRKMVMACTQRLSECHPVFRSQAEHVIIFVPAPIELDLKTIAGHIGREPAELRSALDELQNTHGLFSHLWYCRPTNELRRCAPVPAGDGSGPPATAPLDDEEASAEIDPATEHEEQAA